MQNSNSYHWRLITDEAAPGSWNMAVDEALMENVGQGSSLPILRLYRWSPACLSLGYSQSVQEADKARLQSFGWDLVRRPTGGRAILHTDELTYAVIAPAQHPLMTGGVLASYRQLSAALIAGLQILGLGIEVAPQKHPTQPKDALPVCFEVPSSFEITFQKRKIVGSAQMRRANVVLQHGAIPINGDITRICQVLTFPDEQTRCSTIARVRQRAVTIAAALQRIVSWNDVAQALQLGFHNQLLITFSKDELRPGESELAKKLQIEKYTHTSWTDRV